MKNFKIVSKLAIEALFHNRVRSFLTMLGIIIGVMSVILIMSLGDGAQSLITGAISKIGTDVINISPGASDDKGPPVSAYGIVVTTLTNEDANALIELPHVKYVGGAVNGRGDISHGSRSTSGGFSGVQFQYQNVENHKIISGRFFSDSEDRGVANVAVLGGDMKDLLFPFSDPIGEKIKIKGEQFRVIGLLERKGSSLFENPDNVVFVPLQTAQKKLLGFNHLNQIRVKVDGEENVDIATEEVRKMLRYRHGILDPSNDDFSVQPLISALNAFTAITDGVKAFLTLIAAVSLLVGGIGITNIMYMTVTERTREIGLRKALGAKPVDIKNQFMLESIVLTVFGGFLGIIVGFVITVIVYFIAQGYGLEWQFSFPPIAALLAVVVSILIGVTFGVYPAQKASLLNPIDALRYE